MQCCRRRPYPLYSKDSGEIRVIKYNKDLREECQTRQFQEPTSRPRHFGGSSLAAYGVTPRDVAHRNGSTGMATTRSRRPGDIAKWLSNENESHTRSIPQVQGAAGFLTPGKIPVPAADAFAARHTMAVRRAAAVRSGQAPKPARFITTVCSIRAPIGPGGRASAAEAPEFGKRRCSRNRFCCHRDLCDMRRIGQP